MVARATISSVDELAGELADLKRRAAALERSVSGIGGPYLPLAGGVVSGAVTFQSTFALTGAATFDSTLTLTKAAGPQIILTGATSQWIEWPAAGVAAPTFTTRSAGTKLVLWPAVAGASADYAIGMETNGIWLSAATTAGQIRFYGGVTEYASISNGGIAILGNRSVAWANWGSGWFMQDATWIRSSGAGAVGVWIADGWYGAHSGGVTIGYGGVGDATWKIRCSSNIYAGGTVRGEVAVTCGLDITAGQRFINTYNKAGVAYTDAHFFANPAANNCNLAFHHGGTAPQWVTFAAQGNKIYARDYTGANAIDVYAWSFNPTSSRKTKKNITDWPLRAAGAAVQSAAETLARLHVVSYERRMPDIELPRGERRHRAYVRLMEYTKRNGLPEYELSEHDCATDPCTGTAEAPCSRVVNHRQTNVGLVAEEVAEIVPEAVTVDEDHQPDAINYAVLTSVAIAAIQELIERVALLEAR